MADDEEEDFIGSLWMHAGFSFLSLWTDLCTVQNPKQIKNVVVCSLIYTFMQLHICHACVLSYSHAFSKGPLAAVFLPARKVFLHT